MSTGRIQRSWRVAALSVVFAAPLAVGLVEAWRGVAFVGGAAGAPPPGATAGAAGRASFLWAILVAALRNLGCDPAALERLLPLVSWSGLLAVLVVHAVRAPIGPQHAPEASANTAAGRRDAVLMLPVAAWGVALHRDAQAHAAGGSDASLLALLLAGGLLLLVNHPRQVGLAAAVYALAALLRPEGWLDAGVALVYAGWRGGWRRAGRFAAVWGALVLPYLVWRLFDTHRIEWAGGFAGSADAASWRRGWDDARGYFRVYAVLPVCGLGALAAWIGAIARHRARDPRLDVVLVALVQVLVTLVAVVRAGGDAVFARAWIPATPLLYLVAEETVRITGRRLAVVALAVLVVGMTLGARSSRGAHAGSAAASQRSRQVG